MTKVVNNYKGPIALPSIGVEIPKGGSVRLTPAQMRQIGGHPVVTAWEQAGAILIEGREEMQPKTSEDDAQDYSKMKINDLRELAELRNIDHDGKKKTDLVEALEAWDSENSDT